MTIWNMNGTLSVLLMALSLASTTSGQATKDVSPFVMISNEPYSTTRLNTHASSVPTPPWPQRTMTQHHRSNKILYKLSPTANPNNTSSSRNSACNRRTFKISPPCQNCTHLFKTQHRR
ncbi:hypothetical protein D0863_01001 [Hortaea werneckii]|uniref:Uncharacterized protein n=1 Tax=Hortaea werneckii TaxID=91943 RepID=A0A3M7EMV5_HORWE|nr:hypothetical protein D0863_01001 [Hortaea werneckii]